MAKTYSRLGRGVMAVLAVGVALFSFRFAGVFVDLWPQIDPGIRRVIEQVPVQALTHMLIAPIALLLGPFQFFPGLRAAYPRAHRLSGRVYVAACTIAGFGALATVPHASGGPVAGLGFAVLATLWIATSLGGMAAAMARHFELHRLLMRFSYAMTFGAVTLRLQIPIGLALGFESYPAMSVWLAYTSWIPNVIVVALYSIRENAHRSAPTVAQAG